MSVRVRLVSVVAAVAAIAGGCSSGDGADAVEAVPDIFDGSVVHDVQVDYEQAGYDAMVDTFTETGEKERIEATVTIDGVTYERAGLRLKGNSSLMGLGGGPAGPRPPGGDEPAPESTANAGGAADDTTTAATGDEPPPSKPASRGLVAEPRPGRGITVRTAFRVVTRSSRTDSRVAGRLRRL